MKASDIHLVKVTRLGRTLVTTQVPPDYRGTNVGIMFQKVRIMDSASVVEEQS